jgi:hypothetical protein
MQIAEQEEEVERAEEEVNCCLDAWAVEVSMAISLDDVLVKVVDQSTRQWQQGRCASVPPAPQVQQHCQRHAARLASRYVQRAL